MERRLAAILAADVVVYSRMMEADEAGTLARLNRLRKERIQPLIAHHRGRVFKLMGDGIRSMLQAACHARLGEIDQARAQAEAVLLAFPDFRLSDLRQRKTFRNQADGENLRDALGKAGLPE